MNEKLISDLSKAFKDALKPLEKQFKELQKELTPEERKVFNRRIKDPMKKGDIEGIKNFKDNYKK